MSDSTLRQAVIDELTWQPGVSAAHIGVTASDGVVTLMGHVGTYMEKWNAERAAGRVSGVKGVANELEVRYPLSDKKEDDDIAKNALQALAWDIEVPDNKVKVKVEKGWVTLTGTVDWYYQKNAAEADVRKLHGVTGVSNNITILPSVQATDVRDRIQAALKRNAQIEADNITVTAEGEKVTLNGKVKTWAEDNLVVDTAWLAPGVTQVVDRLTVG